MDSVWRQWDDVLIVTAVGLLAAVALTVALGRQRVRRGVPASWAWRSSVAEVWMIAGTAPWVWMILSPTRAQSRIITPLDGVREVFSQGPGSALVQIVGNLLVFAGFGFLAPMRWRIGALTVLAIGVGASTVLETLQYVLDLGRVSDLGDIVLNGGGAGLAALLSRPWWRRTRSVTDSAGAERRASSVAASRYGGRST
jgi:hypothetical protein